MQTAQKNNKRNPEKAARRPEGRVVAYFSGVAKIEGLSGVFIHETLVTKRGEEVALVIGFDEHYVEALFFRNLDDIHTPLYRSGKLFSLPLSSTITGRVLDGLGKPRDNLGPLLGKEIPVFREAPPIIARAPITTPLTTGIKMIDTALPIGRGQRELIIGDRKLGKSTIAIDTVLHQRHATPPVHCIYVLCGQKERQLNELLALFEERNALLYTTVVAGLAGESYASQYLAPFVGCAIGEYFRDRGEDALIIYDDLSKHAKVYRSIALLLERPPGRESYPGDIFSLHASLLERAAKLNEKQGGGSLTALPIVETQEGDITSFIPTNLISITDGQIYLERGLFQKGFLPAINVGLSVSRVGSKAQPHALTRVVKGIRLALSQHRELQKLVQLETAVSSQAQEKIHRGNLILELLKQDKHAEVAWPEQVFLFSVVEGGHFEKIPEAQWREFESMLLELLRTRYRHVLASIRAGAAAEDLEKEIEEIVQDAKEEFFTESAPAT
ncbi:F0F1 ATP synthase subunit alpha [Candidatus Parcubacteria bacterium]|nr:MAG: F0F1 ATP synthase subunit alpha [Candidatus Parcubacteria bacterium]